MLPAAIRKDHSSNSGFRVFAGEALFRAGQPAEYFYLLERGSLMVMASSGRQVLFTLEAGELFGVAEVLAEASWQHTVIAGNGVFLRSWPASMLMRSLAEMPGKHRRFLAALAPHQRDQA